jgi:hypothetical protein
LRRFNVFVLGVVFGAALLWVSAFVGMLGFSSVEGAAFSALLLFALVVVDIVLGSFLARMLLHGGSFSRRETKGIGLLVGGSLFTGAFVSGLFLGVMILLNTASSHRTLFVFATGPGLGLVYGMVLGVPAVVGATLVELRFYSRGGGGPPR